MKSEPVISGAAATAAFSECRAVLGCWMGDWKPPRLNFIRSATVDVNLGPVSSQVPPSLSVRSLPDARPPENASPRGIRFISGFELNRASAFQFYSNLILIEVRLQIAAVPELPAPAFASTPNEQ
jgi:hypothetical protein